MQEQELTAGVRITVKVNDVVQVKKGYPVYRIIVDFISDQPTKNALIKSYYIWVTEDFTDDELRLTAEYLKRKGTTENDYAKVALKLAAKRFEDEGSTPSEEGLSCSNENGQEKIKDAKNYIHPIEK